MIKKFKNFDADEFLNKKRALKEAVESLESKKQTMVTPKVDPNVNIDDVITGKAIYEDPYLFKICNIVWKRLKNIGEFGVYHDIVYLNNVPGIWFYGIDNKKNIVCCRDTNIKTMSIFNDFKLGTSNKAIVTYSTEKFGFKDMIDQMVDDLKNSTVVNEELLLEAGGFGDGYSEKNIANFNRLNWYDKKYMYDLVASTKKGDAVLKMVAAMNSNDKDVTRILSTFGSVTRGSCKYIVGLANDVASARYTGVNKDMDSLISEYKSKYTGSGPAIAVTSNTTFITAEMEEEEEERLNAIKAEEEARIRKDREKYLGTIQELKEMTEVMCNYVKQNGILDRDDASAMQRRGIILLGKGGIGKTKTVKTVLKEKNMIKNKDYVWLGSERVTADKLYTLMYKYNGKLIIFDDTGDLFEGKYNGPLWKSALQTDLEDCEIGYPGKESKLKFYDDRILSDRQKRYYAEIGAKSDEDKTIFYKQQMKKRGLSYSQLGKGIVSEDPDMSQQDIDYLMDKIDALWKEESQNVEPSIPTHFYYTGVVIIMSNLDKETFVDSVGGPSSWKALRSRFVNFNISPYSETLWNVIKDQILNEYHNESLDDDLCMIPRNMTEEFIEEVENLLAEDPCDGLTYRTIVGFSTTLRGAPGLRSWKTKLRRELTGED